MFGTGKHYRPNIGAHVNDKPEVSSSVFSPF
jgi:hypothetical protein